MNIPGKNISTEHARVFFSLWPSPELRRKLHALAMQYQKRFGGRAMRAETLHLTLLFLGEVQRSKIEELRPRVDEMEFAPFSFCLQRISCWRHNQIAFAAPEDGVASLQSLSESLRSVVSDAGIEFDRRGFTPHVTLLRKLVQPVEAQSIMLPDWNVEEFSLVESASDEQGAHYRNLYTWRCG